MPYTPDSIAKCNAAFIAGIRATCLSDEDYEREYLCEPAKLAQLITTGQYDACVLPAPYNLIPDTLDPAVDWGELFVGVDCGRSRNLTVCWALQRGYDSQERACYRSVAIKTIRDATFPVQFNAISPIVTNAAVAHGLIDQGTQGRALADQVADVTGNTIEPFGMSAPRMAEMAELLRAFVQMRRISLPEDRIARIDILCVRRKLHPNGRTLSYGGEIDGMHGDHFWAVALALYAAEGALKKSQLLLPEPEPEPQEAVA